MWNAFTGSNYDPNTIFKFEISEFQFKNKLHN